VKVGIRALLVIIVLAGFDRGTRAQVVPPATGQAEPGVAARALDSTLSFAELDLLLVERRAMSEQGREILKHLLRARLLDRLAQESRLVVGEKDVQKRWQELEREMAASNEGTDLREFLASSGVKESVFREFLRLAIVQETLARRALGVREGQPVHAEQQEMWLDQVIEQRGTHTPMPPWTDGVAARCGDLEVRAGDFVAYLRQQLPPEDVKSDCYQLLLAQRMQQRMPDLAPEALAAAVEAELARRRAEVAADPEYKGLAYETILGSQGVRAAFLPHDPAVRAAALAHLWVDRTHGPEGLRSVYEAERELFDGRHGTARETRVIFLRAARLTNQLIPRSFEEAERELANLKSQITSQADFERLAQTRSEDNATRERGGLLGWVTSHDERVPVEIRSLVHAQGVDEQGPLQGPLTIPSGCVLVWVGARRAAPGWEEMSAHVHAELRRRFVAEVLPEDAVSTFLDWE
jgi:hypothetical protein